MKLTKTEILKQLKQERETTPNDSWLVHSLCVGDAAERIALGLRNQGLEINPDHVAALGYVHDIGKRQGSRGFVAHMWDGYHYLCELGFGEADANICLTHSFLSSDDPTCTISTALDPKKDQKLISFLESHPFSLEEQLIALCDAMCLYDFGTVEARLVDVVSRHGVGPNTQRAFIAALALKQEFDQLLGQNIYSLFPEIRDSL